MQRFLLLAPLVGVLSLIATAAPILRARKDNPLYAGTDVSVVRSANSNSSCDRSQLRFEVTVPTSVLNIDEPYFEVQLWNISMAEATVLDTSLTLGGGSAPDALSSIQKGDMTILQFPVEFPPNKPPPYGEPSEYETYGHWYLAPGRQSYYIQLRAFSGDYFNTTYGTIERPFTPSAQCLAIWSDLKRKIEAEIKYSSGSALTVKGVSVLVLAVLGAAILTLL